MLNHLRGAIGATTQLLLTCFPMGSTGLVFCSLFPVWNRCPVSRKAHCSCSPQLCLFCFSCPVSDHVCLWLWGCHQKLLWMSPPWALNQWQRLLLCTEKSPLASFLKNPHNSPPSETTGILQSGWIAPGIKHEHVWYDILPRVDWDFIQQLTTGTYTLCWTWILG